MLCGRRRPVSAMHYCFQHLETDKNKTNIILSGIEIQCGKISEINNYIVRKEANKKWDINYDDYCLGY